MNIDLFSPWKFREKKGTFKTVIGNSSRDAILAPKWPLQDTWQRGCSQQVFKSPNRFLKLIYLTYETYLKLIIILNLFLKLIFLTYQFRIRSE